MLLFVVSCGAFIGRSKAAANSESSLEATVTLPPHARGQIAYLVFTSADGFPGDRAKALRHGFVPVAEPPEARQSLDLGTLPPGRYAVSVYLDKNGNHTLDTNWLGIPKEPVGASNNPRGRMGPPHFNECAFSHGEGNQSISITLVR